MRNIHNFGTRDISAYNYSSNPKFKQRNSSFLIPRAYASTGLSTLWISDYGYYTLVLCN